MASQFSDPQKAFILKQGLDVGCRYLPQGGISQETYFNWKRENMMDCCRPRCGG